MIPFSRLGRLQAVHVANTGHRREMGRLCAHGPQGPQVHRQPGPVQREELRPRVLGRREDHQDLEPLSPRQRLPRRPQGRRDARFTAKR